MNNEWRRVVVVDGRLGGLVGGAFVADLLDELGHVRLVLRVAGLGHAVVGSGDLAGVIAVGRRELRPAHRAEPVADPCGDVVQVGGDGGDAISLGGEELVELLDIGLEEVTPRQQRLDLALDADTFGFTGLARLRLGRLDDLVRLLLGLGDRRVGRALGEQQGAADRLRLLGGHRTRRGGRGVWSRGTRRRLLLQLLEPGDGGAGTSLHRRRLLCRLLQRFGRGGAKCFDLALVVAASLDGGELPGADVVRADRHR